MERGGSSLSALDGLRGVAAFAVLLSHCAFAFLPYLHTGNPAQLRYAWEESVFNSPFYLFYSGGFAVSLFFVLSGFVLARKFLLRGNIDDLRASAQKRYARLGIPVLGSVLLGYLLMSLQAIPQAPTEVPSGFVWDSYRTAPDPWEALKQGAFGALLFGDTKYNYVLWTIQLEMIGSMLVFGFLALFGKSRWSGVAAFVLVTAMCLRWHNPGTYLAMFIVGAYLNRIPQRLLTPGLGLPMLAIGIYLASYKSNAAIYAPVSWSANSIQEATGIHLFWPVFIELLAASALILAVLSLGPLQWLLNLKAFDWLGKWSFSLYLTHTFVLSTIAPSVFKSTVTSHGYGQATALAIFCTIAVSLLIAEPFRRAFDLPSIRVSNRIGQSTAPRAEADASEESNAAQASS